MNNNAITCTFLHYAQCFYMLVFIVLCSHRFFYMKGLCALLRNSIMIITTSELASSMEKSCSHRCLLARRQSLTNELDIPSTGSGNRDREAFIKRWFNRKSFTSKLKRLPTGLSHRIDPIWIPIAKPTIHLIYLCERLHSAGRTGNIGIGLILVLAVLR